MDIRVPGRIYNDPIRRMKNAFIKKIACLKIFALWWPVHQNRTVDNTLLLSAERGYAKWNYLFKPFSEFRKVFQEVLFQLLVVKFGFIFSFQVMQLKRNYAYKIHRNQDDCIILRNNKILNAVSTQKLISKFSVTKKKGILFCSSQHAEWMRD